MGARGWQKKAPDLIAGGFFLPDPQAVSQRTTDTIIHTTSFPHPTVIPAQAGIQSHKRAVGEAAWSPACAGMTGVKFKPNQTVMRGLAPRINGFEWVG